MRKFTIPLNLYLDSFSTFAITMVVLLLCMSSSSFAATTIPFTINLSKAVTVTGAPRIAIDVGGVTGYADYTSGSGTSALIFTYSMVTGDVDLDGVTVSSPIDLNGGTIKDLSGNDLSSLTFTPPNTTNVRVNYPSLGMDFVVDADGRYTMNGIVYNDLTSFLSASGGTFTRSSVGTYFDSSGVLQTAASGVPRFDYDPVTHTAKGMLIEEVVINALVQSQNFTGWNNNLSSTVTQNAAISPDGTTNATTISSSAINSGIFKNTAGLTNGAIYTQSIYLKYVSGSSTAARLGADSINAYITINPQTMSITSVAAAVTSSAVQNIGNGWYRFSWTFTTTATSHPFVIYNQTNAPLNIAVYGGQFEKMPFATSYIPTTTGAVTRVSDILSFASGVALTQMQSTSGAFFAETYDLKGGSYRKIVTSSTSAILEQGGSITQIGSNSTSGYMTANLGSGALNSGISKSAVTWSASTRALVGNNGTVATGTGTIPNRDVVYLGSSNGSSNMSGSIRKFKFYPAILTSTQLKLMTQ